MRERKKNPCKSLSSINWCSVDCWLALPCFCYAMTVVLVVGHLLYCYESICYVLRMKVLCFCCNTSLERSF